MIPNHSLLTTIAKVANKSKGIAGGYTAMEIVDGKDNGLELNFRSRSLRTGYRCSITVEHKTTDYYIHPTKSEKLSSSEVPSPLTIGGLYTSTGKTQAKTFRITGKLLAKTGSSGGSTGVATPVLPLEEGKAPSPSVCVTTEVSIEGAVSVVVEPSTSVEAASTVVRPTLQL